MSKAQMMKDIETWSRDKLQQWFDDTLMRYKLVGASRSDAEASTYSTLMVAAAGGLAMNTRIPACEAGVQFAKVIAAMRGQELEIEIQDVDPDEGD